MTSLPPSVEETAASIREFFSEPEHDLPQGRKQLAQMLERLVINEALRSREHDAKQ